MKLSEAAEVFFTSMETVRADTTIAWYQKRIYPLISFLNDPDIDQIDLFALERFRKSLNRPSKANGRKGKISVHTIHGYVRAIKRFFNYLKQRKLVTENPAEELEKPRLPKQPRKGISPQDAKAMLNAAASDPRDYAILLFMRDTGCRAGGVYNLLTDNLDILHNKAVITEKGDKTRTVFYTPETAFALMYYSSIRENPYNEEYYFLNENSHTQLTYNCLYKIFQRLARTAKIKTKFSPHQWRHAAVRSWLIAGMNLKTASEIAGHSSEKVTGDIYGTLNEKELQQLYNQTQKILHTK